MASLSTVRVIDLPRRLPGLFYRTIMPLLGAQVIKMEHPLRKEAIPSAAEGPEHPFLGSISKRGQAFSPVMTPALPRRDPSPLLVEECQNRVPVDPGGMLSPSISIHLTYQGCYRPRYAPTLDEQYSRDIG